MSETQTPAVSGDSAAASESPAAGSNGNGQTGGEAAGAGATETESFIPKGLDVNTLPPEVRAHIDKINKDMVRGFTEKTTGIANRIKAEVEKATTQYKEKAQLYDQLSGNEDFVKLWNDHVQRSQNQTRDLDPNDPQVKVMKELEDLKVKVHQEEANRVIEAFANAVDEKGNKLNGDFDRLNEIMLGDLVNADGSKSSYSLLRAAIELAPGETTKERIANGYKSAKAVVDAIYEEGRKVGLGRVQSKASNASLPPSDSSTPSKIAPHRPKNALEAVEFAKQGYSPFKE